MIVDTLRSYVNPARANHPAALPDALVSAPSMTLVACAPRSTPAWSQVLAVKHRPLQSRSTIASESATRAADMRRRRHDLVVSHPGKRRHPGRAALCKQQGQHIIARGQQPRIHHRARVRHRLQTLAGPEIGVASTKASPRSDRAGQPDQAVPAPVVTLSAADEGRLFRRESRCRPRRRRAETRRAARGSPRHDRGPDVLYLGRAPATRSRSKARSSQGDLLHHAGAMPRRDEARPHRAHRRDGAGHRPRAGGPTNCSRRFGSNVEVWWWEGGTRSHLRRRVRHHGLGDIAALHRSAGGRPFVAPSLSIPVQLLAITLPCSRHDFDQPRNLAKKRDGGIGDPVKVRDHQRPPHRSLR